MSKLVIVVPRSRAYCGRAVLLARDGATLLGPVRILATASRRVARRHGNRGCDPLRPFGHPPSGSYTLATSLPPGYAHPRRPVRFGAVGALLLAPQSGDALRSLGLGRRVFAVHGGPLDPAGRLRPTRGGMRLSDGDLQALFRAMNSAHREEDPLAVIELLEVGDEDVRLVPPRDLRGARRALRAGRKHRRRRPGGALFTGAPAFVLLGVGAAAGAKRKVGRRELLQAALLLVGGLTAQACSSQPSPYEPPAWDLADAAVAGGDGGDDGGDGGGFEGGGCVEAEDGGLGDAGDAGDAGAAGAGTGCTASDQGGGGYVAGGGVG